MRIDFPYYRGSRIARAVVRMHLLAKTEIDLDVILRLLGVDEKRAVSFVEACIKEYSQDGVETWTSAPMGGMGKQARRIHLGCRSRSE